MTNVLWIVLDDASSREFGCYGFGNPYGCGTPNIDALAAAGIRYTRFFSCPLCSPTRAKGLTGRDPEDNAVGELVDDDGVMALSPNEILLPRALKMQSRGRCRCGAFGKWHLANSSSGDGMAPVTAGFDVAATSKRNLFGSAPTAGYYVWERIVNGIATTCTTFATTQAVDDAIAFCNGQGSERFFCYLPLHAPHSPFDRPPAGLYNASAYSAYWTDKIGGAVPYPLPLDTAPGGGVQSVPYFKALLRSTDTELGRLFSSLTAPVLANLDIILTTDNGTQANAVDDPAIGGKSKRSVYNHGVNVPLIIKGPSVASPGRVCNQLADTTDIFPTIGELLGIDVYRALPAGRVRRGISLVPTIRDAAGTTARDYLVTSTFAPNTPNRGTNPGLRAIVSGDYKLMVENTNPDFPVERLFLWQSDYNEDNDLLANGGPDGLGGADLAAYNDLKARYAAHMASVAIRPV